MTQNPLFNSGTQWSTTDGLKPALVAALSSLEVQLDQELARYRRTRSGYRTPTQQRLGSSMNSHLHLANIGETGDSHQPPAEDSQDELSAKAKNNTPSASVQETLQEPPADATPTTDNAAAPNSGSIVPVAVKGQERENASDAGDTYIQPNDYLESSEALLKSVAEEESPTHRRTNSSDRLLSPLGIGSMLLLLVGSMTIGYAIFNPKSLPQLGLGKFFQRNSSPAATEKVEQKARNTKNAIQPKLKPIAKYPNLARDEFPEVKKLNDVVLLKPKAKANPVASPSPINAENPINPATSVLEVPKINSPQTSTEITPQITSPNPATGEQKPTTEIKPSADGLYHIVADNQNNSNFLTQARKTIPDAYLSADQKLIYLGALKTPQEAQKQVQMLLTKGIKARIQQP